jgi:hypothetical protein
VNLTLEPRKVDKPFLRRWLRKTFELFLRSPVRFSIAIAFLGCLDTSVINLAQGYAIQKVWIDRLGMFVLPVLWIVVSAVARGADDPSQTWRALTGLARKRIWIGVLVTGANLAAWNCVIAWALRYLGQPLSPPGPGAYLQHPGQFLDSLAMNILLIIVWVGPCYSPLLALVSDVSAGNAHRLSNKASDINGQFVIWIFSATLVAIANVLVVLAPAYGMTVAAFIVFMGTFNYIAYRDIFERRSENLPTTASSARIDITSEVT